MTEAQSRADDPAHRNRPDAQHRRRPAQARPAEVDGSDGNATDADVVGDEGAIAGPQNGPDERERLRRGAARATAAPDGVRVRRPSIPVAAAGIPAIVETIRTGVAHMGVRKTLANYLQVNKKDGFDCQSCAWPSPDGKRSVAEFCENGAKAVSSEGTRQRADRAFFARYGVDELARHSDQWLNEQGRIIEPMVLRDGSSHYEPIGWSDAFSLVAKELHRLESPNQATFYTSGRASNEAAFLYQLFVRQFGTNNLPDCSNMCHESSGTAMVDTIGVGKSTIVFDDFEHADTILIIGQNPGTNHPRMLTALEHAKRRGATIVSINPMPELGLMRVRNPNPQQSRSLLHFIPDLLGPGTQLSDIYLQVRVNGDVALLKGIMKAMLPIDSERPGQGFDAAFIENYTRGFAEFTRDLEATGWDDIVEASGIPRLKIEAAAQVLANAESLIACWAMGLTQHKNGVGNVSSVINLLLLGGHIGRPGAGACCVRGHSNVQGDRTMGIWERMNDGFLEALGKEFAFDAPRSDGLDSVDSIRAMHSGDVQVLIALGGNLLSAGPDTAYTADAIQRCRLSVQISTKLNRSHLVTGKTALILPCLGRSERDHQASGDQFVTVEDSLGVISSSRGSNQPAGPLLMSEPAIIAQMAAAVLGETTTVDWSGMGGDYGRIRDRIARVIPGFEDFNERIERDVFYLPNAARHRDFQTSSGKANFTVQPIPKSGLEPGQLLLTTIRSHDQFNTTIYGLHDRYRGIAGSRRVILLNAQDIEAAGLTPGQLVDVSSHFQGRTRTMEHVQVVDYSIAPRSAAMYFPEANVLVPIDSVADESNTPTSKSVPISLRVSLGA